MTWQYFTIDGRWFWEIVDDRGATIARCSASYPTRRRAINAVIRLRVAPIVQRLGNRQKTWTAVQQRARR